MVLHFLFVLLRIVLNVCFSPSLYFTSVPSKPVCRKENKLLQLSLSNKCHNQLEIEVSVEGSSILQWLSENILHINMVKTKVDISCREQTSSGIGQIILSGFELRPSPNTIFLGTISSFVQRLIVMTIMYINCKNSIQ